MSSITKHLSTIINIALLMLGFGIGQVSVQPAPDQTHITPLPKVREISVIQLQERKGDQLQIDISGKVRLVLNQQTIEGEGPHLIPLGQIPNQNDLKFEHFPYTGNANTMKFYPSSSQFARGTKYQHRRFFDTKKEAVEAGFKPSKLVK